MPLVWRSAPQKVVPVAPLIVGVGAQEEGFALVCGAEVVCVGEAAFVAESVVEEAHLNSLTRDEVSATLGFLGSCSSGSTMCDDAIKIEDQDLLIAAVT